MPDGWLSRADRGSSLHVSEHACGTIRCDHRCRSLDFRRHHITFNGKANSQEAAMNGMELFAFIILPLSVAASGLAIGYFYGRGGKDDRPHPGE